MPTPSQPRPTDDPSGHDPQKGTGSPGAAFTRLVSIMRLLRAPGGCPWDREQTLETLRPFVLEEAYETVDAIDRRDLERLRGEIGDLIFEGVFLAQVCADLGAFTITESLTAINEKLIRRHPHVFGPDADEGAAAEARPIARSSAEVLGQWERLKAQEQTAAGERPSILGGIPRALPALLRAHEIGSRVAAVGFDWPHAEDVLEKIGEETGELRRAVTNESRERVEEEMGDLLFSLANLARKLGVEPEAALRRANDKFSERFTHLEARLQARGSSPHEETVETLEQEWRAVKDDEPMDR